MKYLKLYENWNPLSAKDLASARELHKIGVVSDKELSELTRLNAAQQKILNYTGVGDLDVSYTTLLTGLPQDLKVERHLNLTGCIGLTSLPAGLTVGSSLSLSGCTSLESLPADLTVGGDLYLYGCTGLKSLPADLKVGDKFIDKSIMKYLKLFESWNPVSDEELASAQKLHQIGVVSSQELEDLVRLKQAQHQILNFKGFGNLDLSFCNLLTGLPAGLRVDGFLNLNYCTDLRSLPAGLVVGDYLYLYDCTSLQSLPVGLIVDGDLDLTGCTSLESLPAGLEVGGNLYLTDCDQLKSLPADLKVGGNIYR